VRRPPAVTKADHRICGVLMQFMPGMLKQIAAI
jgi:hypothetical protein